MSKIKNRYVGVFNYQRETHILYTFAVSEQRAKINFLNQLSKKVDRSVYSLHGLYDGHRDNFSIQLETEFEEVEE